MCQNKWIVVIEKDFHLPENIMVQTDPDNVNVAAAIVSEAVSKLTPAFESTRPVEIKTWLRRNSKVGVTEGEAGKCSG